MSLASDFDSLSDPLKNIFRNTKANLPDAFSTDELNTNELRRANEELKDLRQDRDERKSYAHKLYWLVLIWLLTILWIILLQGAGNIPFIGTTFKLSDTVLITLITTTTANVAAFFLVVVKYLFRSRR